MRGAARHDRLTAALGIGVFVAGGVIARHTAIGRVERRVFASVNGLPASLHAPVWTVMQLGSLGGALGTAAAAAVSHHPALARRLAVAGTASWAAAKAVKSAVGRGRPATTVELPRILGKPVSGMGYPSGHAAVAASLGTVFAVAVPEWRAAGWAATLFVGPARLYVGAHLPLDVVGGVALGVAIGALVRHGS